MSNEGYTIVKRRGRSPRIHLFRPYEQCNTDDAEDVIKVKGSREKVLRELGKMGYGRATSCKRCFPYVAEQDVEVVEDTDG